jgi:tRNA-dependent cyclodipeptide synthase
MRIENCLGTTIEDVTSKKFNIWIGISLGNKYFTRENIREYILWALDNTKDDVLVVIADSLYEIKLEVLDKYSKLRAFKVASRLGDIKAKEIEEAISSLSDEKRKLIKIVRFGEVLNTKHYDDSLELITEFYKTNKEFNEYILNIVKEIYKNSPQTLTLVKIDKLAEYALREIPVYINGCYFDEKCYSATIYPGLGLIDKLIIGLHKGSLFPELANKLKVHNDIAIVDGYVN